MTQIRIGSLVVDGDKIAGFSEEEDGGGAELYVLGVPRAVTLDAEQLAALKAFLTEALPGPCVTLPGGGDRPSVYEERGPIIV